VKQFYLIIMLAASSNAFSAKQVTANIDDIGIRWGKACATISSGHTIHMNIETEAGRAEYSTLLAAFAMKKSVVVYITGTTTANICNVVTVANHGMIYLK
jgi:hypothetical protein